MEKINVDIVTWKEDVIDSLNQEIVDMAGLVFETDEKYKMRLESNNVSIWNKKPIDLLNLNTIESKNAILKALWDLEYSNFY